MIHDLPSLDRHAQKFARPGRRFDSPNIEYVLNALRPNTSYFMRVKVRVDALDHEPQSDVLKVTMPPAEESEYISCMRRRSKLLDILLY